MNNDLILVIIFLIFLMLILFLITYYKKENFSQCLNLVEQGDGICKPFYGIPPAEAITPYYHQVKQTYKHEANEEIRKIKNREAAREICNNTSGCTGISQSQISPGPNETYLCKNEWNGRDLVNLPLYPMKTYKCETRDVTTTTLPGNKLLNADINTGIFGKSFNEFQYKKHLNNKFKDDDLINISDSTDKIKFSVKCQSHNREFKIKSNLKQYIDFSNTMSYCVGFHIHNTSTGYDVYFGKKRDNVDLILDTDGEYVCYTAILTTNHFIQDINALESSIVSHQTQLNNKIQYGSNRHGLIHFNGGGGFVLRCGDDNHGLFCYQGSSAAFRQQLRGDVISGPSAGDQCILKSYHNVVLKTASNTLHFQLNSNSLVSPSDRRVKKDIVSLNDNNSYNLIKNLNPVTFKYKKNKGGIDHYGFIAQDIIALLPDRKLNIAINEEEDKIDNISQYVNNEKEILSYDTDFLVPSLISCMKKLIKKVEILEEKINRM